MTRSIIRFIVSTLLSSVLVAAILPGAIEMLESGAYTVVEFTLVSVLTLSFVTVVFIITARDAGIIGDG